VQLDRARAAQLSTKLPVRQVQMPESEPGHIVVMQETLDGRAMTQSVMTAITRKPAP
jgi:hypothetical protein